MNQLPGILEHVPATLLVVFRIGGLMLYGPVFGSRVIPVKIKVLISFLIGGAIYPLLSQQCFGQTELKLELWSLAPLVTMELLIGIVVGYVASIPLVAVQTGGLVMGQQMGLGFARFYNPTVDDEADVVGQLLFFMALAMFLMIGGHEAMVLAVLNSFQHIQPGQFVLDLDFISLVNGLLLSVLEVALRIAAPLLALVFLQSLAMGFIAKTVPQLNILSLGFPLRILLGIAIIALGLTIISEVVMGEIDHVLSILFSWIESR